MDQSLSITITLEGGLPSIYLTVQDHYHSPSQAMIVPMEFVDMGLLIRSVQQGGVYSLITASLDNPRLQLESPIAVRHEDGKIYWDLVYEHYESFLNIELELEDEDTDEFEEHTITFTFDPFQYVSGLFQAFRSVQHFTPTTFTPLDPSEMEQTPDSEAETAINPDPLPSERMQGHLPILLALWQKHGQVENRVQNGQATLDYDFFAREAEALWLQDILDALDESHNHHMAENLATYLETLPESVLKELETDHESLSKALAERWAMLVNSLTEEEADALEQGESADRFPNSLKLRLMREFLSGNPSVLLGHYPLSTQESRQNVISLQHWRQNRKIQTDTDKPKS